MNIKPLLTLKKLVQIAQNCRLNINSSISKWNKNKKESELHWNSLQAVSHGKGTCSIYSVAHGNATTRNLLAL